MVLMDGSRIPLDDIIGMESEWLPDAFQDNL